MRNPQDNFDKQVRTLTLVLLLKLDDLSREDKQFSQMADLDEYRKEMAEESTANELEKELDAKVPIGESGRVIINPGDKGSEGLIIEGKTGKGSIRGRFLQRKSVLDEMNTQVVTTLEGNAATIYISQRVPFKETSNLSTGNKVTQLESIRFKDVRTGFMVLPHIRGDQVVLEISPQQSRIINGEIETVGISTVLRGRIGEWIELGGLSQNRKEQGSGIASKNRSEQVEKRSVFIKVEKE